MPGSDLAERLRLAHLGSATGSAFWSPQRTTAPAPSPCAINTTVFTGGCWQSYAYCFRQTRHWRCPAVDPLHGCRDRRRQRACGMQQWRGMAFW